MASYNVVKYLNVLGNSIPYPIGTEPRFINSIIGNNSRNLEEQLILGNSCSIVTSIDTEKNLYKVKKTFGSGNEKYIVVSDYKILNLPLLLYIVVDERDGNYQIKTANSAENKTKFDNLNRTIDLSDNSVYNLKDLNLSATTRLCTEKLYYNSVDKNKAILTKKIEGYIHDKIFDTTITITEGDID